MKWIVVVKLEDEKAAFEFPTKTAQEAFLADITKAYGKHVSWVKTVKPKPKKKAPGLFEGPGIFG